MLTPTILACDDDSIIRYNLKKYLRAVGYHVLGAQNAAAAQTIFLRGPKIDLLVTHVTLSRQFDGIALARWAGQTFPGTLALTVTSWYKHEGAAQCFDGLVLKPHVIADLVKQIKRLVPVQPWLGIGAVGQNRLYGHVLH
jgi:CheY-like chemotaxis protein